MKQIAFIFLFILGFVFLSTGQKKEEKANEIRELVENKQFNFIARSAIPRTGSRIDLTSTYELKVDSTLIEAWLPFYGRAYHVDYGSSDGGIKFKEIAESMEVQLDKKGKSYLVNIKVDTNKDQYQIYMNIGLSGYASMDINSIHRQGISFNGIVEPIEN